MNIIGEIAYAFIGGKDTPWWARMVTILALIAAFVLANLNCLGLQPAPAPSVVSLPASSPGPCDRVSISALAFARCIDGRVIDDASLTLCSTRAATASLEACDRAADAGVTFIASDPE